MLQFLTDILLKDSGTRLHPTDVQEGQINGTKNAPGIETYFLKIDVATSIFVTSSILIKSLR